MDNYLDNYNVEKVEIINNNSDKLINNFKIYVINLNENLTRRIYIKYILKKLSINYTLIIVKRINNIPKYVKLKDCRLGNNKFGCLSSHLWCIKNAINNNYDKFIIFEDDIVFKKDFNNMIDKYLNTDFDMLMLGALDFNSRDNLTQLNGKYYVPNKIVLGASANVYTIEFAKKIYNYKINNCIEEFDLDFYKFYKTNKIKICYPNLIINEMSTSNLNHNFNFKSNSVLFNKYLNYYLKEQKININDYNFITLEFIDYCINNINKLKEENLIITKELLIEKYIESILSDNNIKNIDNILSHKVNLMNNDYNIDDIYNIINDYIKEKKLF